jgi:DNA-binding transcriptional regulator YiaG
MKGRLEDYHYTECGLPRVLLSKITVYRCKDCKAMVPEIPAQSELHRAILMALLRKTSLLSGEEIRFIRKMAGYSLQDLANIMGIHNTNLSKWENNARTIGKDSDRMLRLICFSSILQESVKEVAETHPDFVRRVAEVAKSLSGFNIHAVLRLVQNKSIGPKTVTIDPKRFAEVACRPPRNKERTEAVS